MNMIYKLQHWFISYNIGLSTITKQKKEFACLKIDFANRVKAFYFFKIAGSTIAGSMFHYTVQNSNVSLYSTEF